MMTRSFQFRKIIGKTGTLDNGQESIVEGDSVNRYEKPHG